jgi:CBS domain containing-hemolysin-like protein
MEVILQLLLALTFVCLNGFFVASEFALVAVRQTRIAELVRKGNSAAGLVQKALRELDRYISSTQLGITLSSLALGWLGEPVIVKLIEPLFSGLPSFWSAASTHTVAITIAFSLITFLHVVLGELVPKTIALQRAEMVALIIIGPLVAFTYVCQPFIWLLNGFGNHLLKLFGFETASGHATVHSEEEVKMILAQSGKSGAIPQGEVEMVYNVFKLGDLPIKQIMVPRTHVVSFDTSLTVGEVLGKIQKYTHSRYPIYDGTIDSVVGFVHIKDVYRACLAHNQNRTLTQLGTIREILTIPETRKADDVLLTMRKKHIHMAIVKDEFGGTAGIVTLEDILENLVGEIEDEFDKPVKQIRKLGQGEYLLDGRLHIDEVVKRFSLPIKGYGYTTIGGLVFGLLGREPRVGDQVQIGSFVLKVEKIERHQIHLLKLSKGNRVKRS